MWTGNYENPGINTNVEMQKPVVQAEQTEVPTIVKVGVAPPAHITWFVNMHGERPRILDVAAEGISLRATERSDLMGYLSQHGGDLDGLIAVLRQRALATGGNGSPNVAIK
jgi:ABC-type transporter MlaC component